MKSFLILAVFLSASLVNPTSAAAGSCQPCPGNKTSSAGSQGAAFCRCPKDLPNWNTTTSLCVARCAGGKTWTNNACACPENWPNWNTSTSQCAATCTGGKTWTNNACACTTGQTEIDGKCANSTDIILYNTAKTDLDSKKGKKTSGTVLLGPGTYGYELSGAGGGGGGGASNQFDCKSGNNGGDGGNGELKSGVFTLPTPTNVVFSIGGNVSGAGDCGHGGTDNGAPGEPSTIKHGNTTITAVGGGGGKWKGYGTSESPKAPSGAGAKGGLGGQKGGRNPQNGAAGWFILTSYAP